MIWCIELINPLQQELYVSTPAVILWQLLHKSTRCLPPPTAVLEGGGGGDGRGAARLDVLQVAGVAEKVAVQRVAAVTLLVVQLHLTFLNNTKEDETHPTKGYMSFTRRIEDNQSDFCFILVLVLAIMTSRKCRNTAFRTGSFIHVFTDSNFSLANLKYWEKKKNLQKQ